MPDTPKKFYLTTPIYYVNARPHIGHAYTTIAADVIARRHRLLGDDTFFLTGTDEHGQKVERSAAAAGIPPQQFADQVSASLRRPLEAHGHHQRRLHPHHRRASQARRPEALEGLDDRGAIYLSTYTGPVLRRRRDFVDVPAGTLGPDWASPPKPSPKRTTSSSLSASSSPDRERRTPSNLSSTNEVSTSSATSSSLRDATNRKRSLSALRHAAALKDLSISRTSFDWGIPVPGNQKHVIYVWLDALANYITAIGYGSDDDAEHRQVQALLARRSPPRRQRDHPLPLRLLARIPDGRRPAAAQSHRRQRLAPLRRIEDVEVARQHRPHRNHPRRLRRPRTVVRPKQFPATSTKAEQDLFAADVLRYFLLREIPFGQDGSFSFDALVTRYNADLANGYGNLVSRTLAMIEKYFDGVIPAAIPAEGSAG